MYHKVHSVKTQAPLYKIPVMPLKLIAKEEETSTVNISPRNIKRIEIEAIYERRWLLSSNEFNPLKTALGRSRLKRTFECILGHVSLNGAKCVDLGCGSGILSQQCVHQGAEVTAVDIAEGALKPLRKLQKITCEKHCMPYTSLNDSHYDLVIASDLIACLPENEYRLFFSELTRIVQHEGYIVTSTPFDVDSEGAFARFISLAQTELVIEGISISYQLLWDRMWRALTGSPWRRILLKPLIYFFGNNDTLLKFSECLTELIYGEDGVTHAIIIGKRRSLLEPSCAGKEMPESS